jgi:beta-lactamase regulating signal transducer with metallopeptidase domain
MIAALHTAPQLQFVMQALTSRSLNTIVEGILLALLVAIALRVIGRSNSGTRFAIWLCALAAVVALPFFSGSSAQYPAFTSLNREIILSASWASRIFAAWAAIAATSLFRLAFGLWRVHQIRKHCTDVDSANLDPGIARLIQDFKARPRVKLCLSTDVTVPAALGFFRPAIVFPADLFPQLSDDELRVILLHELAHLERRDDWTNLAQKIVKAVFFFHPAVWWIENRLTIEREMACDDAVVAQTSSPNAYASSLISFAEKLHSARTLALAQFLVSRMRQFPARVSQILNTKRPTSSTNSWKPIAGATVALLGMLAGTALYAPQFVAFDNSNGQKPPADFSSTLAATAAASRSAAIQASLESVLAQNARAIPATFNPRQQFPAQPAQAISPRKPAGAHAHALRPSGPQPNIRQASLDQSDEYLNQRPPVHATFVILQTTQYDASGAGIWTLCIWRIEGGDSARDLQSAIVLSVI